MGGCTDAVGWSHPLGVALTSECLGSQSVLWGLNWRTRRFRDSLFAERGRVARPTRTPNSWHMALRRGTCTKFWILCKIISFAPSPSFHSRRLRSRLCRGRDMFFYLFLHVPRHSD
jgi:hypothetical protein